MTIKPLSIDGCRILADTLGNSPDMVNDVHLLKRGLCRAYVMGYPSHFEGAIIQADIEPNEPSGHGSSSDALWELLKGLEGWDCINVPSKCAINLGKIIEKEMGIHVKYIDDICHVLETPVVNFQNDDVRMLNSTNLELLKSAPTVFHEYNLFGSPEQLLSDSFVAGAIVSNRMVSIACMTSCNDNYADIGVATLKKWSGQGYATAAASLVIKHVQEVGYIPVWSTGEHNFASLRVARKLGFTEVSRRTYVVLYKDSLYVVL